MILEWSFGFHAPSFRNAEGRIDPRVWFGHCEAWGYTEDETWVFMDPQGAGLNFTAIHRHDDVLDHLAARFELCHLILKMTNDQRLFRLPLHGIMTCASVCGALVGVRALLPATLAAKLRQHGAEVIHEAERKSRGQGRATA